MKIRTAMSVQGLLRCFTVCLLVAIAAVQLLAQTGRGTIQGTVTDASGARVPNAKIEVTQVDTNTVTAFASNDQGLYLAPNLSYGNYKVTVQKDGFSTIIREPILVRAEVTVRVDFALQTGAVTQSMTVTEEAPVLDLSTASSATSMGANLIEDLPVMSGGSKRNITQLLNNLPGLTSYDPNNKESATWQIRVNGAQTGNSETFVDGAGISQFGIQRGAVEEVGPTVEMVAEFNVVSNAFNAEYGGFGSWFTNATIKSGTNDVHGSVYGHVTNSALNARSFFQPKKTQSNQSEPGFTLGGPVVIPKIYNGRNRTFVFGSLGLFFTRAGAGGALITTATPEFRRGDFSKLVNANGSQIPIFDPGTTRPDGSSFSRTPFPGNVIPSSRITPQAAFLDKFIPLPELPGIVNNYYSRAPATSNWAYFNIYNPLVKFDHTVSQKQKISTMYIAQIRHRELGVGYYERLPWGATVTNPLDGVNFQRANSWASRINHDYVFTPALLSHFTVSADRYINLQPPASKGGDWLKKMGVTGLPNDDGALGTISFTGGTASPRQFGSGFEQRWFETRYTFNESLTWIRGTHTIKFGGTHGRVAINRNQNQAPSGIFSFSNGMTSQPNAGSNFGVWGNSFASYLLGGLNSASSAISVMSGMRWRRWGLFVQDDWRVNSKLTLSYGLRWDYNQPFFEVADRFTSFQPDLKNPAAGNLPGALAYATSYPKPFMDTWKRGFAPRLGLAYQIGSKTVLRASGGLYYAAVGNLRSSATGYEAQYTFTSPDGFTPVYNWSTEAFPQVVRPPVIDPSFRNGQDISYIPQSGGRLPQIVSWTFGVQRQIGTSTAVDLSYIGSKSTHLAIGQGLSQINYLDPKYLSLGSLLQQPINSAAAIAAGYKEPFPGFANQRGANTVGQALKPFPQFTTVDMINARLMDGQAYMNTVQLKGSKRLSSGLMIVSYLTWLQSFTNAQSGAGGDDPAQYPFNRRLEMAPDAAAVPWTFGFTWTYQLPFGAGKKFANSNNPVISRLVSGWGINGFLRYQSGYALSVAGANPIANLGYSARYGKYVGGEPTSITNSRDFEPSRDRYLNLAAFQNPSTFELGNLARTLGWLRGFPAKSESIQISKATKITEKMIMELSADMSNPFNFHRWLNPATNISTPLTFGVVTGTTPGRIIQINAKVSF